MKAMNKDRLTVASAAAVVVSTAGWIGVHHYRTTAKPTRAQAMAAHPSNQPTPAMLNKKSTPAVESVANTTTNKNYAVVHEVFDEDATSIMKSGQLNQRCLESQEQAPMPTPAPAMMHNDVHLPSRIPPTLLFLVGMTLLIVAGGGGLGLLLSSAVATTTLLFALGVGGLVGFIAMTWMFFAWMGKLDRIHDARYAHSHER